VEALRGHEALAEERDPAAVLGDGEIETMTEWPGPPGWTTKSPGRRSFTATFAA